MSLGEVTVHKPSEPSRPGRAIIYDELEFADQPFRYQGNLEYLDEKERWETFQSWVLQVFMGEEKGMTKSEEPMWKGCPRDHTKGQLGKLHYQKGARAWPQIDRKRDVIVGPEPIMRKWDHIEKRVRK